MAPSRKWDLFVSHAYEDKAFVKRVVDKLQELEIRVWYDEFVLRAGDSISESIDFGIANSDFGLAVFSRVYFKKFWTKEEMAGMRAREPLFGRIIIPVWLNIQKKQIVKFSATLSDRLGIVTDGRDTRRVATEIAKVVKPEALERWHVRAAYRKVMKGAVSSQIDPRILKKSPHRHKVLNLHQLSRLRLLQAATADVFNSPLDDWIDNFRRDLHPDTEIIWWERFVAAYLAMLNSGLIEVTLENKKKLYSSLFGAVNGQPDLFSDYLLALPKEAGEGLAAIGNKFFGAARDLRSNHPENLSYRPDTD